MREASTVSVNSAQGTESTAATNAWMQLSFNPSSPAQCRSMSKICTEKATAHSSSSTSPLLMPLTEVQLSRYSPTMAGIRLSRAFRPGFWPRKSPKKGTKTIYMAVRNPALPASVYTRPICCRLLAANRARPQMTPERHSAGSAQLFQKGFPLENRAEAGKRNTTARKHRTAWKVKGPILSMPTLWAIKAEPQITVAPKRAITPDNCFFIRSPWNNIP